MLVSCKDHDYLEQDDELRGQRFFCMSTVSPEDVLLRKDVFMFNRFLKHFSDDIGVFFKNTLERFKDDAPTYESLTSVIERYSYVTKPEELAAEFEFFKGKNNTELENEFHAQESFTTTVRGIKIRGVFDTLQEARHRAEKLSKTDKSFNVYIGQVGCWCPWSPCPDLIDDQEFAESSLNTLVKKYKETEAVRDEMYRLRKEQLLLNNKKEKEEVKQEEEEEP